MIRIYHTSDLHDRRGIAAPLQRLREREPGWLFDCGDALRGSQTVYHRHEPIVDELAAAGYDAVAFGNREFHYLFPAVAARTARMRYPIVCSNLVDTKRRTLPFRRSLALLDGGVRVHLVGLLVVQYPTGSSWERIFGWRFLDPLETAAKYAAGVPDGDLLIALSHLGLRTDRRLAAAVPRIDFILGGHSHDTLFEPEYSAGVPIVHAGPYGQYVSRSELRYDPDAQRFTLQRFALLPLLEPAAAP